MKGNQALLFRALYEGGQTRRWHTVPHHEPNLVSAHSWGVAIFILAFHDGNPSTDELDAPPGPSLALIRAALLHDVHERWSGDGPSPARRAVPALQAGENEVQHRFWDWAEPLWSETPQPELPPNLSARDLVWLKLADAAEAWFWCEYQLRMGNLHVEQARDGCRRGALSIVRTHSHAFVDPDGLEEALIEAASAGRLPESLTDLEEL